MRRGILAAVFVPPTTKDFVYGCWGPSLRVFGLNFCFNFVLFLVVLTTAAFILLFFGALRRPKVVPGKLQSLMEMGLGFVREQVSLPMLGSDGDRFLPLLTTFFFFILLGNFFEVLPGFDFSANSRIAFPLEMALLSWVTYNAVGIRKHGFVGYLKFVCIIPAAPWPLRYTLLPLVEFVSQILIRPVTLSVRLAANFLAGHFLLAVFFLGTIFFLKDGPKTWIFAGVSFPFAVLLVGFEIFVAVLQAFIFTILTASYIGGALAEEH